LYEVFLPVWKKEIKQFFFAFINKNELYSAKPGKAKRLSEEEQWDMYQKMSGIKKHEVTLRINSESSLLEEIK
jgi:DNA uptake protein ComE-like DNA-binding protein